jgi:hypothetical protein
MKFTRRAVTTGLAAVALAPALPARASTPMIFEGRLPYPGVKTADIGRMMLFSLWHFDEIYSHASDRRFRAIVLTNLGLRFETAPGREDDAAIQLVGQPLTDLATTRVAGYAARAVGGQATFIHSCRGYQGGMHISYPKGARLTLDPIISAAPALIPRNGTA